jgi:hypothetical protein
MATKIKARTGIYSGQPSGISVVSAPLDMHQQKENKKRSAQFGVVTDEPCGTTFEHAGTHIEQWTGLGDRAAGGQTKKPDRFGVETKEPQGETFMGNRTHVDQPSADVKVMEVKTISETHALYRPAKTSLDKDMVGDVPVGRSSPKKGRTGKGAEKGGYGV